MLCFVAVAGPRNVVRVALQTVVAFLGDQQTAFRLFILQKAQSVLAPQNLGSVLVLCDCDRPAQKTVALGTSFRCALLLD
jgi:hypothetical protein